MNNLYYAKYLKYKNKYLELKNLLEGGETNEHNQIINCAITTHNGRLRCLLTSIGFPTSKKINLSISNNEANNTLDTLNSISEIQSEIKGGGFINFGKKEDKKDKEVELRFKNCAVILMKIDSYLKTINFSLVYSGEVKPKEGYYFYVKTKSSNPNEIEFPQIQYTDTDRKYTEVLKKLHIKQEDLENKILNIYMIRHGEGIHNTVKGIGKIKKFSSEYIDAGLTSDGMKQALGAGQALNNIKFNYIFVSDLARTRQTIQKILNSNSYHNQIKKIFVLPCSHELDFVKSGQCDGGQKISLIENENKMSCNITSDTCDLQDDDKMCCDIHIIKKGYKKQDIELDWQYYREFYNSTTRRFLNKDRLQCRDTSMISMALYIINNNKNDIDNGLSIKNWIENRI